MVGERAPPGNTDLHSPYEKAGIETGTSLCGRLFTKMPPISGQTCCSSHQEVESISLTLNEAHPLTSFNQQNVMEVMLHDSQSQALGDLAAPAFTLPGPSAT